MIYIAGFILIFSILQLVVSLINLIVTPSIQTPYNGNKELITVMIPARNEEKNILNIISDLQHQTYHQLEIIIFDDQSTDKTAELVNQMARYDKRIRLISSDNLPQNWLGKNYACHQMSLEAKGDYFLFVDADVRMDEYVISNTFRYFRENNISLLSIFPKQIMLSSGEKSIVPLMNYILLTLLPLFLVLKSKFPSLSAANGQFMMFDALTYKHELPHELMKSEKVEDIKIARYYKNKQHRTACIAAKNQISCRMYNSYDEALNGFSKNIIMFFGNSIVVSVLFWLITTFGFIFVLTALPVNYFIGLILLIISTRVVVSLKSGQHIMSIIMYLIPQQINLIIMIIKSKRNAVHGNYEWKGRKIK